MCNVNLILINLCYHHNINLLNNGGCISLKSKNNWKPNLYDDKIAYVSQYGQGIFDMLAPKQNEKILDIGCGTGDLTKKIAEKGANPTGIDASNEMIETAKQKYPDINFIKADATSYRSDEKFDAVFSNAALHWMTDPEAVIKTIASVLSSGGRFVAEFGGKDNIATLLKGMDIILKEQHNISVDQNNPWYFPSIAEYTHLLEKHHFRVVFAQHFDRPTTLADGIDGLDYWLDSFADDFFPELTETEKRAVYEKIKKHLAPTLYIDDHWQIDYKRLRIIATK